MQMVSGEEKNYENRYLRREKVRVVLQRVSTASVRVDHQLISEMESGLLVLLGIENEDFKRGYGMVD